MVTNTAAPAVPAGGGVRPHSSIVVVARRVDHSHPAVSFLIFVSDNKGEIKICDSSAINVGKMQTILKTNN